MKTENRLAELRGLLHCPHPEDQLAQFPKVKANLKQIEVFEPDVLSVALAYAKQHLEGWHPLTVHDSFFADRKLGNEPIDEPLDVIYRAIDSPGSAAMRGGLTPENKAFFQKLEGLWLLGDWFPAQWGIMDDGDALKGVAHLHIRKAFSLGSVRKIVGSRHIKSLWLTHCGRAFVFEIVKALSPTLEDFALRYDVECEGLRESLCPQLWPKLKRLTFSASELLPDQAADVICTMGPQLESLCIRKGTTSRFDNGTYRNEILADLTRRGFNIDAWLSRCTYVG